MIFVSGMQLRMARAAVQWTVKDAAVIMGVGPNTLRRAEVDTDVRPAIMRQIVHAYEDAGVRFLDDDGITGPGIRCAFPEPVTAPGGEEAGARVDR